MNNTPVVKPGEFAFAAVGLKHGHINTMCQNLINAGAELVAVYDNDPALVAEFQKKFPTASPARVEQEILDNKNIRLVATADIPNLRSALGIRVLRHGKDFFCDKAPFTTLEQLREVKQVVRETNRKYMVYFAEGLTEGCEQAYRLIQEGAIGRLVQMIGLGPHKLNVASRPSWFFTKAQYGGILCDIGSHQADQFLWYSGNTDAEVVSSQVGNYQAPQYPELEDFGEMNLRGANGVTGYHRVDWLTPNGLGVWGDGRTILLGTDGYIEIRHYIDITKEKSSDHVFIVDQKGQRHIPAAGTIGFPYFGKLIRDCIERTETSKTQAHCFKAAELALTAQAKAVNVTQKKAQKM